ncbi:type III pantothenate kinase [Bacteroidia bacterium]|nr:type III pantothenate kinase [Bacteroidia bacterium]
MPNDKKLVVDIGNTLSKLAIFDGHEMVNYAAFEHLTKVQLDMFTANCDIQQGIICTVGSVPDFLIDDSKNRMLLFDVNTPIPIVNDYETPDTLGCDRLALAVAANALAPQKNTLVISLGTCITYEVILKNATYVGGAIAPGLQMRFKALHQFTARLPRVNMSQNIDSQDVNITSMGKNTTEAIRAGVMDGMLGEIQHKIAWVTATYEDVQIFLTGGDVFYFVNKIKIPTFVVSNMVLIGLNEILDYNINQCQVL